MSIIDRLIKKFTKYKYTETEIKWHIQAAINNERSARARQEAINNQCATVATSHTKQHSIIHCIEQTPSGTHFILYKNGDYNLQGLDDIKEEYKALFDYILR